MVEHEVAGLWMHGTLIGCGTDGYNGRSYKKRGDQDGTFNYKNQEACKSHHSHSRRLSVKRDIKR